MPIVFSFISYLGTNYLRITYSEYKREQSILLKISFSRNNSKINMNAYGQIVYAYGQYCILFLWFSALMLLAVFNKMYKIAISFQKSTSLYPGNFKRFFNLNFNMFDL